MVVPSTFSDQVQRSNSKVSSSLLRNAASFVPFLIGPLQMSYLSRALGADGFGRWWWTFPLLEAAGVLGMFGADLHVRRELARQALVGDRDAMHRTIGSSTIVALVLGAILCVTQISCAESLARGQHDPALEQYLVVLAIQPLFWNLTAVFAAALQSVDAYGTIAVVRGVIAPLTQCGFLAVAWLRGFDPVSTLAGTVGVSFLTAIGTAAVFMRHFDPGRVFSLAWSRDETRRVLGFGSRLVLPNVLWMAGGKIDVYLLRRHVGPAELGVYAACLTVAAVLPNLRGVFDPVAQREIALHLDDESVDALQTSLRELTRWCALVLLPFFVGLVAIGEPMLDVLLGRSTTGSGVPLAILGVGQILGSIALASWLTPMALSGRVMTALAAATLVVKTVLLVFLIPRAGAIGAAIATAAGTILAQQGLATIGARARGLKTRSPEVGRILIAAFLGAVVATVVVRSVGNSAVLRIVSGALATGGISLVSFAVLVDAEERRRLFDWLRRRGLEGS